MRSSWLSLTFLYLGYSFSNAQFPGITDSVSKWTTGTRTIPAKTITESGGTFTLAAETVIVGGTYDGIDLPGITHASESISSTTEPATTITELATTETIPARTEIFVEPPAALVSKVIAPILYDMEDAAPDVNSLPIAMASKLNAGYTSLWGSYTSTHPSPSIFSKVDSDLNSMFDSDDPATRALAISIFNHLIPYPDPTQTVSIASVLSSLLAPYPTLASEISVYMTALEVWEAPEILAEYSMIRSDLSITTPAPTWLSLVSAFLPTATGASAGNSTSSASQGRTLPIPGASVLVNAGIAAVGIAVIVLM